ncbi:hypothetical protein GALMADRAFT_1241966 [Galerina marginata CBS 339.88]|uniref:Uncharacterized protein n=1 Tax=Galerina marginata (strain CBS 339.88) TaxID=685588 RepID=A0A067THW5_GALM3|nr:hypothetical protein GALMADRAFT_1241966 [Galerina marginata CBS 339.88]
MPVYAVVAFVLIAVNTLLYFIAWIISMKRDSNWDSEAFRFGFTGMISVLCFGIVFSLVCTSPRSTPTRATAQIQVGSTCLLIMLLLFGVFALRISNLGDSPSCFNGDVRCSIITAMTSIGLLSSVPRELFLRKFRGNFCRLSIFVAIAGARITYRAASGTDFVALDEVWAVGG